MMVSLSIIRDTALVRLLTVQATDTKVSGSKIWLMVKVKNLSEMGKFMKVASVRERSLEKVR